MEKPKQDKKVKASQEEIEMFFVFVAANENKDMKEMLEENPSLVYAKDEQGDTALYNAVAMGKKENLETAKILMEHGADPKESKVGIALQFDMDPHIRNEMAKITLGVDLNNYSNTLKQADIIISKSKKYNAQISSDSLSPSLTPIKSTPNRGRRNSI